MSSTQIRAALFETQRRVLEAFARGEDLDVVLCELCEQVEARFGAGERCSISIVRDGRFVRSIAPGLPEAYAEMMRGVEVGPTVGSCGTAVHTGEPVIVTDVQSDPHWEDYLELADLLGPSGCWAMPVFARHEEGAIASFAVYGPPGATPSPEQREFLQGLADVTGLVISRARLEQALAQNAENLQRMQRMESLGELAGGIAHDFNNILVGVFGGMQLAQMQLPEDHPAQEDLRIAAESLERAKALTGQLLTFAKGGDPMITEVDLADLVPSAVRFDLSGSSVEPVLQIPDDLWRAKADRGQLQQVFSNLVLNAREAMDDEGHLHVEVDNAVLEDREVPDGPYVRVSVRDEGCGLPPEDLDRLFNPYFSTREGGSGLGLTTVHSIITRHGGTVSVESTVGEGTEFTFFIPAIPDPTPDTGDDAESTETTAGPGHVLVMDDEPGVRRVCVAMLERLGYVVEVAPEGETAVRLYRARAEQGQPFDLVIMDLTVPGGIGGKVAVRRLLDFDPDARVIASSGYADDAVLANPADHGFVGILPKPYTYAELQESVRGVLG